MSGANTTRNGVATGATPAVVQNTTTAEGTGSTPSTRTLEKLSEANAQLAEESTQLMARNAALEARVQELEAEENRGALQYGVLHNENKELKEEVAELQRKLDDLRTEAQINAESTYEANQRAEHWEWDNTRLRRALLEQATVYATTLKALLPQA